MLIFGINAEGGVTCTNILIWMLESDISNGLFYMSFLVRYDVIFGLSDMEVEKLDNNTLL